MNGYSEIDHRDPAILEDLIEGWRPVCRRRARKLYKRGERVEYRASFDRLAWLPCHLRFQRKFVKMLERLHKEWSDDDS